MDFLALDHDVPLPPVMPAEVAPGRTRSMAGEPDDVLPQRYQAIRRLGGGATADVFLAEDHAEPPLLKAVKVLRANVPATFVAGFRAEFRALASLQHPGLARVFDFGELPNGRAYFTAEYVEGRELVGAPSASVEHLVLAMADVCRALGYLHSRGWVHNDVKPGNILVGGSAEGAKLLDFGLAGLERAPTRRVAGTPGYIAPERLAGAAWDGRADLYAVGASLYRVLGGRRVTNREQPSEALAELAGGRPLLAELRPDLPEPLSELVERLLEIDPAARPRHAFAVISRLGEVLGRVLPLETPGSARCYAFSSAFIGRAEELLDLERSLHDVGAGRGPRLLGIAGGGGNGKSRLLRQLVESARTSGWRVAAAECNEHTAPMAPLTRLAGQLGVQLGTDEADDACGVAGDLFRAVAQGGTRTLLAIDDVHRGALSVLHAAFAVAARATTARIPAAVLVTYDRDALPSATAARLDSSIAAGDKLEVALRPLGHAELRSILVSLFGDGVLPEPLQEAVLQRSGGSPLLLEEIVRELLDTGAIHTTTAGWTVGERRWAPGPISDRLEDFLRRRCAQLPPEGAAALALLSAVGGRAPRDAVIALGGPEAATGLSILSNRALVIEADGELCLEHEALAAIAVERLGSDRRQAICSAAVEWLAAHDADDARLAWARREAGDLSGAFEHSLRASARAWGAGEGRQAVRWAEEALLLGERAELSGERLVAALRVGGDAYRMVGRQDDARRAFERAFALVSPKAASERVRWATSAAQAAITGGEVDVAERWLEQARRAHPAHDGPAEARIVRVVAMIDRWHGRIGAAREGLRRALALLDAPAQSGETTRLRGALLAELSRVELSYDLATARALAREAVALAEAQGDRMTAARARSSLAAALCMEGEPRAGALLMQHAIDETERFGDAGLVCHYLIDLANMDHVAGEWESSRRRLDLAISSSGGSKVWTTFANLQAATQLWHEGDFAGANGRLALVAASSVTRHHGVYAQAAAAAAAAHRGDAARAEELAARAEAEARVAQAPLGQVQAAVVRAYALLAADAERGGEALCDAAEGLMALGHRDVVPTLLRDAGDALFRAGERERANRCLARALEMLVAIGSTPGSSRIAARLAALGSDATTSLSGARLTQARSLDELAGVLASVGAAAGVRSVHLCAPLDGRLRLLGDDNEITGGLAEMIELAERALESGRPLTRGALSVHPLSCGPLRVCLAVAASSESGSIELLLEAANVALALLEARASATRGAPDAAHASDTMLPDAGSTRLDEEASGRTVELTVGPLEPRRPFPEVIGRSPPMTRALALLDRLADADGPVLITGETGTGKEVFARALHAASARRSGPLVAVNCAGVPWGLFEAELFGYKKGSFTGAIRDHQGFIRQAHGGVLFLDEIGEMPAELQPKLLRVLEDRGVRPVGSEAAATVDVRFVAATNRDLAAEVDERRFRADLYYRLSVVELRIPPLRERTGDVPDLVQYLMARRERPAGAVTRAAMRRLVAYHWPGNVRELENELERASLLAGGGTIGELHLSPKLRRAATGERATAGWSGTLAERLAAAERDLLREALRHANGNRTHTARALGLTRQGLVRKLQRLGLQGYR